MDIKINVVKKEEGRLTGGPSALKAGTVFEDEAGGIFLKISNKDYLFIEPSSSSSRSALDICGDCFHCGIKRIIGRLTEITVEAE